jgi:hypothetical protein
MNQPKILSHTFLKKYKYELLLFGLFQHLFMAMFIGDIVIYSSFFWPLNMIILGVLSFGVYIEKTQQRLFILRVLVILICSSPLFSYFYGFSREIMIFLSISYFAFFAYIFLEVIKFLIKPSYVNKDVIVASGCGYLLLIEMATFIQQSVYYIQPNAFKGLDVSYAATTYIDFVYFSSIVITSIGFGDILPNAHYSKLLVSLIGITGQFYAVVLVGILISKFTSRKENH